MTRWTAPSPTLLALPAALGMLLGQPWALAFVPALFVLVVAVDLLRPAPAAARQRSGAGSRLALWLWPAAQTGVVAAGLSAIASGSTSRLQVLGMMAAVGLTGGLIGMPAAHELMHRRNRCERALAEWLLALSSYSHFGVEHVRGHHRRVGLAQDAATARLGESLYAFFGRAVVAGARDAWVLEAQRQHRLGRRVLDPRNTVLRGALLSALLWAAVYTATGGTGLAFFIGQGLVAVFVLETVNYVQHYGLVRQDGRRAAPAWNSDAPAGNWLLLNLGRHSDHHGRSDVPHERLCMRAYTPTLPTGLPGMALLAVLPPLWFRVMDSLARHWRGRLSS